jgi:hypothetical protein
MFFLFNNNLLIHLEVCKIQFVNYFHYKFSYELFILPLTCMLSVLEIAGGTPLSALQRYFPECSARAVSNLREPLLNTTGSDTPPKVVSVEPLENKNSLFIYLCGGARWLRGQCASACDRGS